MHVNRKVIKYLALVCLVLWLIVAAVFKEQINGYFYTYKITPSDGAESIDYDSQDQNVDFELAPGETLVLPIRLETRLSRVGIYLGEQEDSSDQYVFQLEDEYGSVLGKTITALSDIRENEFLYVSTNSLIDNTATYYIRIYSYSANEDNQSLKIKASLASDFETDPFSVSEAESEYTLILDRRYHVVGEKATKLISLVLIAAAAVVWLADTKIIDFFKEILCGCIRNIPWRMVVTAAIGLFLVADLLLPFFPRTEYVAQNGNKRSWNVADQALPLYEGVVAEQYIKVDSEDFDSLGILFATYMKVIKNGVVHIELLDADDGGLLFSNSIKTAKIVDNTYQCFHLPEPASFYGRNVLLRIWAEYTNEGTPVALYLSENYSPSMYAVVDGELQGGSLIFEFSTQVKTFRTDTAIVITSILIILIICYVWKYAQFQQIWHKYFICVPMAALLLLLPSLSLLNFKIISLDGMTALLSDHSKWAISKFFEETELKENLLVEDGYDLSGVLFSRYERTEIPINGNFSSISLHFSNAAISKKDYNIWIYWDTGKGYNDKQSYIYRYIHRGEDNISFCVPCNEIVGNVLISIGDEASAGVSVRLPDEIFPINGVEINSLQSPFRFFSAQTLVLFVVIFSILAAGCVWKYFQIDARLWKILQSRNISISFTFVIIATIYGVIFSFILPTRQVPDEPAHLEMLCRDMGDFGLSVRLVEALGGQGLSGVDSHQGQTVDIEKYVKASANHLDDYSLHGIPSIRVLRRPGQTLGVLLGMLFHLPAYWVLQLAELGGLVVYVAMGVLTLKTIPFKKSMMMMIMLLPVAMQQAGSLSYDSFTNALSFFTIAYILYLKVEAKTVSWRQISILFLLAMGLLIGKFIYVLLLGLVLIVPLSKLELRIGKVTLSGEWIKTHKRYAAAIFVVMGCAAFAGVWAFFGGRYYFGPAIAYVAQFLQLLRLYFVSVQVHKWYWLQGAMTTLAWNDLYANLDFVWMVVMSLFICALIHHERVAGQMGGCRKGKVFSAYDLLIIYGVFFALFIVVLMSMISWGFLSWRISPSLPYAVSMRLLPRIEGVQGRYFLPIIPLLFIPLHTKKDIFKGLPVWFCKICYYLCITIYPISMLLGRYWGIGQ